MILSNKLPCKAGSSSCRCNPHRFFSVRGFDALFPGAGTQSCMVCLTPQLSLPVYLHENVSSLTPWLSNFHTVRFSGRSGYFVCLNLLLSFFWLCKEATCITYTSILTGSPEFNHVNFHKLPYLTITLDVLLFIDCNITLKSTSL